MPIGRWHEKKGRNLSGLTVQVAKREFAYFRHQTRKKGHPNELAKGKEYLLVTKRSIGCLRVALLFAVLFSVTAWGVAGAEDGQITGTLERVTKKFKTFCVMTTGGPEIIKYGDDTAIKDSKAESVAKLPSNVHLIVDYTMKDGQKYAKTVTLKVAKVAPEDLIGTKEVAALVEKGPQEGNYLIIDARPEPRYDEGHLPGSVLLPFHEWDKFKDKVLPEKKDTKLIFYCGGLTCPLSPKSADKAKKLGYTDVKVYHEGIPDWKKVGLPVTTGLASLKKLVEEASKTPDNPPFFVVVDLRSAEQIDKGFIPYATKMTSQEVVQRVGEFPKFKNARIVLYTEDKMTPEAVEALRQLMTWKYKSPAILDGGFSAWKASGGRIATGKPADKIAFVKKVAKDEIPVAEFKGLLKNQPGGTLIVDVRSPEEFNVGAVPGAKSMPLEKLQKDVSDIPKDKKLVVICNTGAISFIANKLLEKKGYDTRYLNATIKYDKGGYEILE